jgi:hypothetical protein
VQEEGRGNVSRVPAQRDVIKLPFEVCHDQQCLCDDGSKASRQPPTIAQLAVSVT